MTQKKLFQDGDAYRAKFILSDPNSEGKFSQIKKQIYYDTEFTPRKNNISN